MLLDGHASVSAQPGSALYEALHFSLVRDMSKAPLQQFSLNLNLVSDSQTDTQVHMKKKTDGDKERH